MAHYRAMVKHLHVIDSGDMADQAVLLDAPPDPARMSPVAAGPHPRKPIGGLWTSTLLDRDRVSEWRQWASGNMPDMVRRHMIYAGRPAPGLRVIEVDSAADGRGLFAAYGAYLMPSIRRPYLAEIDFERAAADGFAGLHLTRRGLERNSGQRGTALDFVCFDCESTIWFTWPFAPGEPHRIVRRRIAGKDPDRPPRD
jgi:hypothetical protein